MIDFEQMTNIPAPVALIMALNFLAIAVRKLPKVPNWAIPFLLFGIGMLVYPRITTPANTVFTQAEEWALYVTGFMIGGFSFGADSLLAKFDWYKRITNSFGDAYTQGKPQDSSASSLKDGPK